MNKEYSSVKIDLDFDENEINELIDNFVEKLSQPAKDVYDIESKKYSNFEAYGMAVFNENLENLIMLGIQITKGKLELEEVNNEVK